MLSKQNKLLRYILIPALTLMSSSAARCESADPEIRIVALGDSTTFGYSVENNYPRQLEKLLKDRKINAKVINSGVNGDTTDGGWLRFERDVLQHDPAVVIVQFGLNDQPNRFYNPTEGLVPYVTLEKYEANLKRFVEVLQSKNVQIMLMTPNLMCWTPVLERLYPKGPYLDPPLGGNGLLQKYVAAVRHVAREHHVPLVDIYESYDTFESRTGKPIQSIFLNDGVHPNERGYAMNVERILPTLMEMLVDSTIRKVATLSKMGEDIETKISGCKQPLSHCSKKRCSTTRLQPCRRNCACYLKVGRL